MGDRAGYSGMDTYEYINTGTYLAPVWSRIGRIGDVDVPNNRSSSGFKTKESGDTKFLVGTRERGISFTYTKKLGADAVLDALKAGYDAGNAGCVDIMVLDGPAADAGSKGTRGPYLVTKFDEKRPHEDKVTVDVELKPADALVPGETYGWEIEPVTIS